MLVACFAWIWAVSCQVVSPLYEVAESASTLFLAVVHQR